VVEALFRLIFWTPRHRRREVLRKVASAAGAQPADFLESGHRAQEVRAEESWRRQQESKGVPFSGSDRRRRTIFRSAAAGWAGSAFGSPN